MSRIKYYNTTTQEWEYADGLSGGGGQSWTAEQITLLETVFANIVYADPTTGQAAARQLIESLRGVVPSEYDIAQVGDTLIISRAPATKSNDTLIIT